MKSKDLDPKLLKRYKALEERYRNDPEGAKIDADAINKDWQAVGQDMSNAFEQLKQDEVGQSWWEQIKSQRTPAEIRNTERYLKVYRLSHKLSSLCPWMNWPILKVVYTFWSSVFEEGIRSTIKPRWGAMTFAFLNDGFKPTLWHTWQQITGNASNNKYEGIWPDGAPKNKKEADARLAEYSAKRGK